MTDVAAEVIPDRDEVDVAAGDEGAAAQLAGLFSRTVVGPFAMGGISTILGEVDDSDQRAKALDAAVQTRPLAGPDNVAETANQLVARAEVILAFLRPPVPALAEAGEELPLEHKSKKEIRASITPEAIISFIDGKSYKTLARHLTRNNLTKAEYRSRFGLPDDYPFVAPDFAAARSEIAKKAGFGKRG